MMADVLSPQQRSFNMAQIRGRDTKPEITLRKWLSRNGYRYRLNSRDLPGKPDIVFPRLHKVIFVHGCFWHMHRCRYGKVVPKTNAKFWQAKREGNVDRDKRNLRTLRTLGYKVLIVWECQLRDLDRVARRVVRFLA